MLPDLCHVGLHVIPNFYVMGPFPVATTKSYSNAIPVPLKVSILSLFKYRLLEMQLMCETYYEDTVKALSSVK